MLQTIISSIGLIVVGALLIKFVCSMIKGIFKSVTIKLSKITFFLNTVVISGMVAVVAPTLINKDPENTSIKLIVGLFVGTFIVLQLLGNNVNFQAGWSITRTLYNIVDGYLLGNLIFEFLKEKDITTNGAVKVSLWIAVALVLFIGTYFERKKREYEGE